MSPDSTKKKNAQTYTVIAISLICCKLEVDISKLVCLTLMRPSAFARENMDDRSK